ncbi:hypothetical protein [Rhodococcus sp. 14-2470-1b]|nr:hypothetical protein [Rhodococcus sp. 14-2470-1b]
MVLLVVTLTGITMTVLRDDHGTGVLIGPAFGMLAEVHRHRSTSER